MLNEFRSAASGFAAKILLALLVLSFGIWGVGDMVRHPGSTRTVATVGGTPIYVEYYQAALRREIETLQKSLGEQATPELIKEFHPEKRALQTLIHQTLLKQEAQSIGVIPSDADVVKRIRSTPNFQTGGKFDKNLLETVLKNNHMSEKNYVERLRQDLATGLIINTMSVSLPVTDIAVKTWYEARDEQRGATLYILGEQLAGAAATPKTGELEDYFAKHAASFTAPEYRSVSYVTVKPEDARNKINVSEEALLAAYKDRIDEFKRPERRDVDQLLFASEADAKKASDDITGGKTFDEVAKTAPITNKGSVSLGKVEHDRILDSAADDVFALPQGGVTKPIQSAFGWHIFRVKSIEAPSTAPLSDVRAMLEKDVKAQMQEDAQNSYTNKLEDALAGGATLPEVAKEFNLTLQTVGPILRSGKSPSGAAVKLPELDKFLDTAFATQEKSESPLIGSKNGVYYILRVDSVTPERNRSLDEVRASVTEAWQRDMRSARLSDIATTIASKFADKKSRDAAIAQYHLSPAFTGALKRSSEKAGAIALPQPLVADIFKRAPGDSTDLQPLATGGYIIAIAGDHIAAPPMDKKTADDIRKSLEDTMNKEVIEAYLRYLEQKHPVVINEQLLEALNKQPGE
jgi:peptidyl-prolyl cis-trans isomerase D